MEDREGQDLHRRKLLRLLGIGVTGLAGCSSGDSEGNGDETPTQEPTATPTEESGTGNDETPTPEDTETPTPEETPTGTPENGEEELFVPDGLNEENYRALIEQIEQDESLDPETVLTTLGVTEEQVSDPGYATLQSLVQEEDDQTALNLVEKIVNYGENHGQIGTPQARVLSAAPMSTENYVNAVLDGSLEQSSSFESFTQVETELFGIEGFQDETIQNEYQQIIEALAENGFTEEEIQYLSIAADYGSERIGDDPRIKQARQNGLWVPDANGLQVDQQVVDQFRDSDNDLLINKTDPNPQAYTLSNDIYSEPIVNQVFKGDPTQDYVLTVFEKTRNVNQSEMTNSVQFVGDKLADHNINLIAIERKTNVRPANSQQDLESLIFPPNGDRIKQYMNLGTHYILFANEATPEYSGLNWDTKPTMPEVGYVDNQFHNQFQGNETINALGHELAAMLGGRGLDHVNEEGDDLSSVEKESFQSYVQDYEDMRFIEADVQAMRKDNFNLGTVRDGEVVGRQLRVDELENMFIQGQSLDDRFDMIYAQGTELDTIEN